MVGGLGVLPHPGSTGGTTGLRLKTHSIRITITNRFAPKQTVDRTGHILLVLFISWFLLHTVKIDGDFSLLAA